MIHCSCGSQWKSSREPWAGLSHKYPHGRTKKSGIRTEPPHQTLKQQGVPQEGHQQEAQPEGGPPEEDHPSQQEAEEGASNRPSGGTTPLKDSTPMQWTGVLRHQRGTTLDQAEPQEGWEKEEGTLPIDLVLIRLIIDIYIYIYKYLYIYKI